MQNNFKFYYLAMENKNRIWSISFDWKSDVDLFIIWSLIWFSSVFSSSHWNILALWKCYLNTLTSEFKAKAQTGPLFKMHFQRSTEIIHFIIDSSVRWYSSSKLFYTMVNWTQNMAIATWLRLTLVLLPAREEQVPYRLS